VARLAERLVKAHHVDAAEFLPISITSSAVRRVSPLISAAFCLDRPFPDRA
jgi:hypothetical protein